MFIAKVQGSVYIRKRVSVTVEEICECFLILFFGLEGTKSDSTGVLTLGSGSVGQVTTLGEDLLSVGVSGFVHETMIAPHGALWGKWWTVPQLVAAADLSIINSVLSSHSWSSGSFLH